MLKFLHIAGISIWAAGLISLPSLYLQRAQVQGDSALYRLQNIVRYAYVRILSPAAFIAISSGIALIFLRETFAPWFSLKLVFVAMMALIHTLTGLVIIRLFNEGEIYPVWRFITATVVTSLIVLAVLVLVLSKPTIDVDVPEVFQPGGLRQWVQDLSPWAIP
ncbi:putative membrane protein [Rhodoligotrophos appendicifer]